MGNVGLLYVGAILFLNGLALMGYVKDRGAVPLNIFVGLFNLLPLLPLDGGHLAVLGIEAVASKVRRRDVEIDQRHLVPITVGVMGLLMLLFVSSLYLDILNPVKLYP